MFVGGVVGASHEGFVGGAAVDFGDVGDCAVRVVDGSGARVCQQVGIKAISLSGLFD